MPKLRVVVPTIVFVLILAVPFLMLSPLSVMSEEYSPQPREDVPGEVLDPTGEFFDQNGQQVILPTEPPEPFPWEPGEFIPPNRELPEINARGIYLTARTAGTPARVNHLIDYAVRNGINTFVIDIKERDGRIFFDSEIPLVNELGADVNYLGNVRALLAKLRQNGIYTISRQVVFADDYLTRVVPEWAIRLKNGTVWEDQSGISWSDPYNTAVWDYNIAIAKEAASLGFHEIQFDYVRFPEAYTHIEDNLASGGNGMSRVDAITGFLKRAKEELSIYNVHISADLFGLTTSAPGDMGIGQDLRKIAEHVDFVSPMVYPSHYWAGSYGLKDPNSNPYETVYYAMRDGVQKIAGTGAKLRPWLQDFSLYGVDYGAREVALQIKAAKEFGVDQWMLWNPANVYKYDYNVTQEIMNPGEASLADASPEE